MSWTSLFGFDDNRVDGDRARELVAEGAQLVDVRTPGEYAAGHLPDAVLVPVSDISTRWDELDMDRPVVLYCRSGARSSAAARVLRARGFEAVYDLGPMHAWNLRAARAS